MGCTRGLVNCAAVGDKAKPPFSAARASLIQGAAANARGRKDQSQ
jgi:hypothetical protein